jgi:hypothetical protein
MPLQLLQRALPARLPPLLVPAITALPSMHHLIVEIIFVFSSKTRQCYTGEIRRRGWGRRWRRLAD